MAVKTVLGLLIVSLIGNAIGLYAVRKYLGARRSVGYVRQDLTQAYGMVEELTDMLDRTFDHRLVFLHHSVGSGILHRGGLRDSLLSLGILARGATYGDDIGEHTDIGDWFPKFRDQMKEILQFKTHPNKYYAGSEENDVVMFKSCFPNSDINADGDSGNTLPSYRDVFNNFQGELAANPTKLFVYLTSPPLHPDQTTLENASRAREFNTWILTEFVPRYRQETGLDNFIAFDLFDVLADEAGVLRAEYRRDHLVGDSHPNDEGYKEAARRFMQVFRPEWERRQSAAADNVL